MEKITLLLALTTIAFAPTTTLAFSTKISGIKTNFVGRNPCMFAQRQKRDWKKLVMMPSGTPMVPWQPPGQDYAQFVDIYSRLMRDRIMLIGQYIDEEAANNIITTLLYLKKESPTEKITLYINIPGANLRPAMAVYDLLCQMREECEISTLNLGLATGMGALFCGAGTKGKRTSMPNARFLLQRTGMEDPFQGQATDIGLEVSNVKNQNDRMEVELAKMTGRTVLGVRQDMRRDFYLSSEEAVAYGLIDAVLLPPVMKASAELEFSTNTWTGDKVLKGDDFGLGQFGGEDEQRYGEQSGGGWGTGWKVEEPET